MSATTTTTKRRSYSITVEAEATAYLDDFDRDEIAEYCYEHGIKPAPNGASPIDGYDDDAMFERLYYATRGDGPIPEPLASELRAMLRDLAGRSV